MLIGFILMFLVALQWTAVGVLYNRVGRQGITLIPFGVAMSLEAGILSLFLIHWPAVPAVSPRDWLMLSIYMGASGILGRIGLLILTHAMTLGHSAMSYTISQSALALSFIFAVIIWRENVTLWQWLGLTSLLIAMPLLASRGRDQHPDHQQHYLKWVILTLSVLALFALSQICLLVPSHWPDWSDNAQLRVPISLFAATAVLAVAAYLKKQPIQRRHFYAAIPTALLTAISLPTFMYCVDKLAAVGLSAIAYPVCVGGSIIGYTLYSRFILREAFMSRRWVGVALGTLGIILLACQNA